MRADELLRHLIARHDYLQWGYLRSLYWLPHCQGSWTSTPSAPLCSDSVMPAQQQHRFILLCRHNLLRLGRRWGVLRVISWAHAGLRYMPSVGPASHEGPMRWPGWSRISCRASFHIIACAELAEPFVCLWCAPSSLRAKSFRRFARIAVPSFSIIKLRKGVFTGGVSENKGLMAQRYSRRVQCSVHTSHELSAHAENHVWMVQITLKNFKSLVPKSRLLRHHCFQAQRCQPLLHGRRHQ